MKVKKAFLKLISSIGLYSAKKACNTVTLFDCYQPKEPEELKKLKNRS